MLYNPAALHGSAGGADAHPGSGRLAPSLQALPRLAYPPTVCLVSLPGTNTCIPLLSTYAFFSGAKVRIPCIP